MKKFFNGFVAKVEVLKSVMATVDKNGLEPMILRGIAGEMPSKSVVSGTLAQNMELQEGGVYLFNATEKDFDPQYGRNFNFMKISQNLNPIEILQASDYVGRLRIVDVDSSTPTYGEDVEMVQTVK